MQNPTSAAIYVESNESIEKMSKLGYTSFMKWTFPGLAITPLCISVVNYLNSDSNEDTYRLAFPTVYVDFNTRNIFCFLNFDVLK